MAHLLFTAHIVPQHKHPSLFQCEWAPRTARRNADAQRGASQASVSSVRINASMSGQLTFRLLVEQLATNA